MNPEELPLRDIHLPPDISAWPPAPGWWLLLAFCLLFIFIVLKWWERRQPVYRKQVVRPALLELTRIETDYADDANEMIRQLSILLRRSAISLHSRHQAAGLTGTAWLEFLDQQHKQRGEQVFSTRFAETLTQQPYREQVSGDAASLVAAIRDWLKQQETPHV